MEDRMNGQQWNNNTGWIISGVAIGTGIVLAYAASRRKKSWQDRLVERFVERRLRGAGEEARRAYHDSATVGILANLGMSTQLAVLGVCIAVGHPLWFVVVGFAELVLVAALFVRRESLVVNVDREVVLDHR